MLNKCIRRYFFPSRAKEAKKKKEKITPDLRLSSSGQVESSAIAQKGMAFGFPEESQISGMKGMLVILNKEASHFQLQ